MRLPSGAMLLLAVLAACVVDPYRVTIGPADDSAEPPEPIGPATTEEPKAPPRADPARHDPVRVAPVPAVAPSVADAPPLIRIELRTLEDEILAVVNRERARAGSTQLTPVAALNRAARIYAVELAERGEIAHESNTPGRRTFRNRIEAQGVSARLAGENLARLTASPERLPPQVVDAWMRSPGHRTNLLDRTFTRTGMGAWLGHDGIWYVVQVFASSP